MPARSQSRSIESVRLSLDDGASTTVHVASYPLAATALRVQRLPGLAQLETWCAEHGVADALVAGFYVRSFAAPGAPSLTGLPLGELWIGGRAQEYVPFTPPWGGRRACVGVVAGEVRIGRREDFPDAPSGDLLQAGPLLVRDRKVVSWEEEGFAAGAEQFDSDITVGRHPRAALGCDGERLLAVACDGRSGDQAGLSLDELAATLAGLGAREALNLDGGGSTSLVHDGRLRNTPREAHEIVVPGGRAIATAFVFGPR